MINCTLKDFWAFWKTDSNDLMEIRIENKTIKNKDNNLIDNQFIINQISNSLNIPRTPAGVVIDSFEHFKHIVDNFGSNCKMWFGVNPRKIKDGKYGGNDAYVKGWYFIFIDIDRKIKKGIATNEQIESAKTLAEKIINSNPMYKKHALICSGNGIQLLIKLDKPILAPNVELDKDGNPIITEELIKIRMIMKCVIGEEILNKFKNDIVEIDSTSFSLNRVGAMPFTKNIKSLGVTERKLLNINITDSNEGLTDFVLNNFKDNESIEEFNSNIIGQKAPKIYLIEKGKLEQHPIAKMMLEHDFPKGGINNTIWFSLKLLLRDSNFPLDSEEYRTFHMKIINKHKRQFSSDMPDSSCVFNEGIMINFCKNHNIPQIEWGDSEIEILQNKVKNLLIQRYRSEATEKIVEYISKTEHIYTTRNDIKPEIWIYKDGIYIPQGRTFIKEFCRQILNENFTTHLSNEIVQKIETQSYIFEKDFFIDEDVNKVPVLNGILNLKTKEIEPFSNKYRFFNKLPITFDKTKDCLAIKQFFKDILKSNEDIKIMQELFGYLLYRDYKIEKAFMFTAPGRNGKSKTIELMKRFIGVENCSSVTLNRLEIDQFALFDLFGKMANLCGDIGHQRLQDTDIFKRITGHDLLSAPRKFLTSLPFVNYAKLIFSCNEIPITTDITNAFFNRWVILDFPFTFLSKKEINLLEDKTNLKVADKEIIEKITSPNELSGLLNWSLIGLDRLLTQGDFSYANSAADVKKMWIRRSSSINAFIQDEIVEDFDGIISKSEFRQKYVRYCKAHNIKPVSDQSISWTLSTQLGASSEQRTIGDSRPFCWVGIKLKNEISLNDIDGEE